MNQFSSDGERLELALSALRNICDLAENPHLGDGSVRGEIEAIARSTVGLIENSQKEPAADINDLLLQLHEH